MYEDILQFNQRNFWNRIKKVHTNYFIGREVSSAILVRLKVEVLETNIVSGLTRLSSAWKMLFLSSKSSSTASITMSLSFTLSKSSFPFNPAHNRFLFRTSHSPSFNLPVYCFREIFFSLSRLSSSFSISSTSIPAAAIVWAIPFPLFLLLILPHYLYNHFLRKPLDPIQKVFQFSDSHPAFPIFYLFIIFVKC
jgi:hypothetical protein